MKTNRKYLSRAKEIKDKALGAKKVGQPTTAQSGMAATLKKKKRLVVSGGPSRSLAPEVVSVPPLAPSKTIPIVDLEGDIGGFSPAPVARV